MVYFRREYFLLRTGASVARQFAASFSAASWQLKPRPDRRHRAQQFNRELVHHCESPQELSSLSKIDTIS